MVSLLKECSFVQRLRFFEAGAVFELGDW